MENDDNRNDLAFGKVSEECRETHELSFEDDFSPTSSNIGSLNNQNQEKETWQADGYLQSLGKRHCSVQSHLFISKLRTVLVC